MIVAYARTSTQDQIAGLEAQVRDLRAAGAERIIEERASSAGKRIRLDACLAELRDGDIFMVTKPDRLARSTSNLLTIVEDLKRRRVGLIVLSMSRDPLNADSPTSKLMLAMLGAVAEFERSIMLERLKEGMAKAKEDGKMKGRGATIDAGKVRELFADLGASATMRELGISRASVYRLAKPQEPPIGRVVLR